MKIDVTKNGITNLLALVNSANTGQTITGSQVTAGTPSVKTDTGDGRNTTVVLSAVAGQGFSGTVSLNYTRRALSDGVVGTPDYTLTETTGLDASVVLADICTKLGLVASELHLTDGQATPTTYTGPITTKPATVTLTVNAGSLLYVDGLTQAITMTWNDEALTTAVTTTNLPGFDHA